MENDVLTQDNLSKDLPKPRKVGALTILRRGAVAALRLLVE